MALRDETIRARGWTCLSLDELKLEEVEFELKGDDLGDTEVDVEIFSSGLCHSDLHMMKNDWGITTFGEEGLIPGHEGVGRVIKIGKNVTEVEVGQNVGIGWICGSCKKCEPCLVGEENTCQNGYQGTILNGHKGCFATHTRIDQRWAIPLPESLDLDSTGPLLCAGVTVFAPLKRWLTRPGMMVGIIGVGGLGHLGIQFATRMGATVWAITPMFKNDAYHKKLGAEGTINNADDTDLAKYQGQFDLLLNTSPVALDWDKHCELLKSNGTLILCGIPEASGKGFELPFNTIVFRQITVAGSIVGGSRDCRDTVRCAAAMDVRPAVEVMPMSKINEAIQRLEKNDLKDNHFRFVLKNKNYLHE